MLTRWQMGALVSVLLITIMIQDPRLVANSPEQNIIGALLLAFVCSRLGYNFATANPWTVCLIYQAAGKVQEIDITKIFH